jgi:Xaa-Pro aminopeptidase
MHSAALREMLAALKDLGILGGLTVDQALEDAETYKRFCPHKTSHWLGLETHDVGAYALSEGARQLEPGMVLTIEPGLYIRHDCLEAPPELRGLGIRIEDDVLITPAGPEVLTAALPTRADQIEAMLREQA